MLSVKFKFIFSLVIAFIIFATGCFVSYQFYASGALPNFLLKKQIEESFSDQISRICATHGDILELAVLESTERFERVKIDMLGESKVRVSLPATFRFYIKISEPIKITITENEDIILCEILAPKLRCARPVAFDTNTIKWEKNIAILHSEESISQSLEKKISARLQISGEVKIQSGYVFPYAKKSFEKFAQTWVSEVNSSIKKNKRFVFQIKFENEPNELEAPATQTLN